jgi:hypothetical protein
VVDIRKAVGIKIKGVVKGCSKGAQVGDRMASLTIYSISELSR